MSHDVAAVKRLLAMGADVDARNENGQTPLIFAVLGGDEEFVRLLLAHRADVNARCEQGYEHFGLAQTPLMLAVIKERTDLVQLLLAHGANVEARNDDGKTVCDLAARDEKLLNFLGCPPTKPLRQRETRVWIR